jgi:general secretion pathway protein D
MKTNYFKIICFGALALLLGGSAGLQAQQRFGGFGGFGGFGNNNNNRNSSTTSSYNNNGTVGSATITVDPETHNIVVIADEQTSQQISNVLANLDTPKPQVLIKVVFMEVNRANSSQIGIQGGWTKGLGNSTTGSVAQVFGLTGISSVANNFGGNGQPLSSTPSAPSGGFYQIVGSDYQATLQAIAQAGHAQVLSRPSILARDGQLAEIVVGQQVYLPSGVTFTTAGNTTTPIINGTYTDVGIILDVTPFIGENSLIQMILQPKITSIDTASPGQVIATSGGLLNSPVYAPNVNTRSANTVVVTPDAEPVVIGGLIGSDKNSSDQKIPLLGDIPLLGKLFTYSSKSDQKTELLIFLTPHIVREPDQLAALSADETHKSQIITNGINEQELNQFLDRLPTKKN